MKRTLLIFIVTLWPRFVAAQSYINPDTIYQHGNIILHDSDVYYSPFAPPGAMDTRKNLCNISDRVNDPNGVGGPGYDYFPLVYNTTHGADTFVILKNWSPCGIPIGQYSTWQRLFQSTHGDIIAGGGAPGSRVTVSKNEDVDFRAHGRVILKSGFHVKPGAFFHAYTDPQWDTAVFSDEFTDSSSLVNGNKWHIGSGWGDINAGAECSSESNIRLWPDTGVGGAHDGWALDIMMREPPGDTCNCSYLNWGAGGSDTCTGGTYVSSTPKQFAFTSAMPYSCPFPFSTAAGLHGPPAYQHMPYGKYEFRDKIPHLLHHTNNWGIADGGLEFDLDETWGGTMGQARVGWGHALRFGPYNGIFRVRGAPYNDTLFVAPGLGWGTNFQPNCIIINNVFYGVDTGSFTKDTVVSSSPMVDWSGYRFPGSIVNTIDSTSFYYEAPLDRKADNTPWSISTLGGYWRVFHAPYRVLGPGDSMFFNKGFQPTQVILTTQTFPVNKQNPFPCRWDYALNAILLNPSKDSATDSLLRVSLHNNTEAFSYTLLGTHYPVPGVLIDRDTSNYEHTWDTAAYATTAYRYHTFALEWLPHEVRILYDSVVVRRFPDRLIPPGDSHYDWASTQPRSNVILFPAQFDIDLGSYKDTVTGLTDTDWTGSYNRMDGWGDFLSTTKVQRQYFETHPHNPGFWDVEIPPGSTHWYPAAHHLLDYVKVWDVPKDVTIPNFPR